MKSNGGKLWACARLWRALATTVFYKSNRRRRSVLKQLCQRSFAALSPEIWKRNVRRITIRFKRGEGRMKRFILYCLPTSLFGRWLTQIHPMDQMDSDSHNCHITKHVVRQSQKVFLFIPSISLDSNAHESKVSCGTLDNAHKQFGQP